MNGIINHTEYSLTPVATATHPCVFKTYKPASNQGILPAGMLFAQESDGDLIPYDRAGVAPANDLKGVLAKEVDTAAGVDEMALGIVHGTVALCELSYSEDAVELTQADIKALEAITIYPQ